MIVTWHVFVAGEHFKVVGERYRNVQQMGKDRKKLVEHFEGMSLGFIRVFGEIKGEK